VDEEPLVPARCAEIETAGTVLPRLVSLYDRL
jgi:hypothetical protein